MAQRQGFWLGFLAYAIWGFFPLYWPLLAPAGPVEILAHRIFWSLAVVVALVFATRRWRQLRAVGRRQLGFIAVGALTIGMNWGMYIYGVVTNQVVETALGYFINPLVTILWGVLFVGERLRRAQWIGLLIALAAVVELTFDYGRLPWLALTLAFSFGTYGLMKKKAAVGSTEGLALETAILAPLALGYLVFTHAQGTGTFGHAGWGNALLLVGTGVITAIPLLMFGAAATRVPLTTLGLLQYFVPIIQFAIGLLVFHEHMTTARWVGFGLVWVALVVITVESLVARGTARRRVARVEPELV
ncbi:EamA family transporter RarD [Actinokineospora auranticolor]|uniref:Chloramphenicol-sensitive protein RarD n=1 Tax=Actinokineospora auranticolor TaxID=155976 RepID=A0A2S6GS05_9PSEU|nr:EamA family transporter RarD [Actinokineospora auranticolor]PPK68028.1 chloramphenicol-sensitive protein RarD [Actinokineospora auranticolor]